MPHTKIQIEFDKPIFDERVEQGLVFKISEAVWKGKLSIQIRGPSKSAHFDAVPVNLKLSQESSGIDLFRSMRAVKIFGRLDIFIL